MAKEWLIAAPSPDSESLAQSWCVPTLIAQLLINRGLTRDDDGKAFLAPRLNDLYAPALLPGATRAASIIAQAVREKHKILIYGDYDVDGTCGVAILWHVLNHAGANVGFYVPHRIDEGYGLNADAVQRLVADGARVLVSVDCGITAHGIVDTLRESGVKVIITDHHAHRGPPPRADAVVHPTIGGDYPNPDLCGAGVAFKLAWEVSRALSIRGSSSEPRNESDPGSTNPAGDRVDPEFRDLLINLLPLAALGTIADVVPLRGENRIIATHGLKLLPSSPLPGLRCLIETAGLDKQKVGGQDVGFKIAPRINAAGRMGHARLAVELFTRADENRAREIALYLEEHNRSRRAVERKVFKEACEIVERKNLAGDGRRAIVLAHEGWHGGVIGIVASRIVERYYRPAMVIAISGGSGQGSARGIRNFDLADALARCDDVLLSHGGHAMAAGIRIDVDKVEAFTDKFVALANNRLTADDLKPKLRLDTEVLLSDLTLTTAEAIQQLEPFGAGNPRPKFATGWVELGSEPRCVGKQRDHLQASFRQNGTSIKAIGFGMGELAEDLMQHRRCRIAFEPIINDFNGRRTVEMQMIDLKFPE